MTAALSAIVARAAAAWERPQVGELTCDISGGIVFGSQPTANCTFAPSVAGPAEFYRGTLTKRGLDVSVSDRGAMVWFVHAPSSRLAGTLARSDGGATARATVGAGVGAHVLVAASNRTVASQPISLQEPSGSNVGALTREFFDVEGLIHATGRLS